MSLRRKTIRIAGPLVIVLAAVVAVAPFWFRSTSCGHDFDFHLVSWLDVLHGWRQGIFYPHWTPSANYGAGEPRFVFYPPLTWMLGAILGAVLPWRFVPGAMTILLLAAGGLATRALARQKLSDGPATLAGCAAIFSGYSLFTAYERSAFAEMTGAFWIPLMLLLVLGGRENNLEETAPTWRRALDSSALLLALLVAGAWLSNAPVGVMASYLLAGFAIAVAVLSKSWVPVIRAALGTILGLGLAAFYLVPAAWEQRWVDIRQATDDPGLLIENSWLFARHASAQLAEHDRELYKVSLIAVFMVAVTLGGLLVSWQRRRLPAARHWWISFALIPVAVLVLQLPISLPIWNALPKLRFLQFPWRWLVALEAPMGIFLAAAVWPLTRWRRWVVFTVFGALFLGATATAGLVFYQECDADDSVPGRLQAYEAGEGFEGTDEYAAPMADNSLVATGLPAACLVKDPATVLGKGEGDMTPSWSGAQGTCDATFNFAQGADATTEHLRMRGASPEAGFLVLRLRTYPAWQVRVNGRAATSLPSRADGLLAVPVPQGSFELNVDWADPSDARLGRWISFISILVITLLGVLGRRPSPPRVS
jgi:hypothetical protein